MRLFVALRPRINRPSTFRASESEKMITLGIILLIIAVNTKNAVTSNNP